MPRTIASGALLLIFGVWLLLNTVVGGLPAKLIALAGLK